MSLYDHEVFHDAEKRRKESNRVINLIDGSEVPNRPAMFTRPEPKRSIKREGSSVEREPLVKREPQEERLEHATAKRGRNTERGRSRSRPRGVAVKREYPRSGSRDARDRHERPRFYAEDLCRKCIVEVPSIQEPRPDPRPAGMRYSLKALAAHEMHRAGRWSKQRYYDVLENEEAFASHELCLRCIEEGFEEPADGVPCPKRLDPGAIRQAHSAIETEVKTGAYDALNTASCAVLHQRGGQASDASRERMYEIRDQLGRALSHVNETLAGPMDWDRRHSSTIYAKPWETSAIGRSDDVRYQRLEQPSARSHNGDSFAERARRGRAFGKSGKGGKGNARGAPGHFQDLRRRGKAGGKGGKGRQ